MKTAIFPGSFNPFTKGHYDIVSRALTIFDKVVIGIGYNPDKPKPDDLQQRIEQIAAIYKDDIHVEVEAYDDLTIDFAKRHDATAIVKGVRSIQDFEYERTQAEYNRMMSDGIETVILFADPKYSSLSSSIVRTLKKFGKDVTDLLP
jgi:pantetheine-phosphate adenylyltransferase